MRNLFTMSAIATLVIFGLQSQIALAGDEQGSSHGQPFKTLGAQIDRLDQRVVINEGDIEALKAADIEHEGLIAALDARLTDLEARVADNESDIDAIVAADILTQQLILALTERIGILESRADGHDVDIFALEQRLAELQADLLLKQDRVSGVCGAGSSIRIIHANGQVVCEVDDASSTLHTIILEVKAELPGAGLTVGKKTIDATCPSSHRLTGGGYRITVGGFILGDPRLVQITENRAVNSQIWRVHAWNDNVKIPGALGIPASFQAYVTSHATCVELD